MSKLQSIVFHDLQDEDRLLEIQFFPDRIYISIEWPVGKGGLGGMRAESFELTAEEARRTAIDILDRFPE
jgi:hypothetical protein